MTDFDYDVLQKKRIATGAYHRKGGSKSKRCSLPSDHLTEAQKRKLNGPVTSVNLNQPITWKDFKPLSDELKKKYLMNLINTYRPSAPMLGEMFGVSNNTVNLELHRLGLPTGKSGGKKSSAAKSMWEAFCNGVVGGGDNPNYIKPEANDVIEAQDDVIEAQTKTDEPQVTCYDAEAEAEARAVDRLESLRRQGMSMRDAIFHESRAASAEAAYQAAKDVISEYVANVENFAEQVLAEEPKPVVEVKEEPSPMRSLSAEYEGDAERIAELMGRLAQMFYGDKVKVKLSIEVVE